MITLRWQIVESIGPVVDRSLVNRVSHEPISLIIQNRTNWSVDGKIVKVERSSKLLLEHLGRNIPD
jgi:hypothetical protein